MPIDVEDDELEGLTDEEKEARRKAIVPPITPKGGEPSNFTTDEPLSEPKPESIGEPIQPLQLQQPYAQRPAYERYQKLSAEQQKPWGDLGIGGKIGRVAEGIGSAIVPGPVSMIPGTELHHQRQVAGARTAAEEENKEITNRSEEELRAGQTEEQKALAQKNRQLPQGKPEKPQGLAQDYADAVQEAISHGQDPAKSPKVQQLADSITALQKQPAAPKDMTAKPGLLNGKPAWAIQTDQGWIDPETRQIVHGFQPQPTYAQTAPATRTTELLGPDNVMHRFQFNEATQKYDIDMGPAPTGTAAHQIFQAGAIEKLAPEIIADINANRPMLGNLLSYYKQWTTGTPVADPAAAKLMTELMSFAAMQPALHAFRSTNALEAFEKIIGSLAKNPDATIATIEGILKTPEAFTNLPQRTEKKGAAKPTGGAGEMEWDAKAGKYVPKKKAQ